LISRAATAALSLLAARRVLIVGDVKQLAPISKISKVLPMTQATWLARSSLSHLQQMEPTNKAVHLLREQYRMHPQIRRAVSDYQYDDSLQDSAKVVERDFPLPAIQRNQPRAIWYVLDEDKDLSLPSIRAERGPGNRSWVRNATTRVLGKLFSDPEIGQQRGLFLSPFKAQAKAIAHFLKGWPNWSAATIHSQQGAEADIVIFDTVNAGSTGWSYEDWKRLINVGISRAKECVLLLASRAEMNQPYLNPLSQNLAPRILTVSRGKSAFHDVALQPAATTVVDEGQSDLLGVQIARRKALRPVLSAEQQQLIGRTLDEGPRLVRGVAGSGKTVVLAHWLVQTLHKLGHETGGPIWAVFANKSLEGLIRETIEDAWKSKGDSGPFPWHKVSLLHIKDILQPRLSNVGLNINAFDFNWDEAAKSYLQCIPAGQNGPCCRAIFIDEAQDMGPNALKLLVAFVEKSDPNDPNSRAVNIFYDNAQNIFGRPRPTWTEIGLNMTGRSTIMKESFRSTKPIAEFALNVLYRLQPPQADPDHQELIKLGLIEKCTRDDKDWWDVRFNQVNGPRPIYDPDNISLDQEMEELGNQLVRWIRDEAVKPRDICIIYNDGYIGWRLGNQVAPKLKAIGVELLVQTSQSFTRDDRTILATTPHSFKGMIRRLLSLLLRINLWQGMLGYWLTISMWQ
jgi:hypothetical protein